MNNYSSYEQQSTYVVRGIAQKESDSHGEAIVVRQYRGQNNDTIQVSIIGEIRQTGGLITSVNRNLADCNGDGNVNSYDSLLLQYVINNNIPSNDYSNIAFHPFLCNLYMEEGLNSVTTAVNIDASDMSRLSNALVGKIRLQDLPELP